MAAVLVGSAAPRQVQRLVRGGSGERLDVGEQTGGGVDHEGNQVQSFWEHRSTTKLQPFSAVSADAVLEHPLWAALGEVLIDEGEQLVEHRTRSRCGRVPLT